MPVNDPMMLVPAMASVTSHLGFGVTVLGIVALIVALVQDRPAVEIAALDIKAALAPFDLASQLSSNRTQGVPNMIALIRETAARYAAG